VAPRSECFSSCQQTTNSHTGIYYQRLSHLMLRHQLQSEKQTMEHK